MARRLKSKPFTFRCGVPKLALETNACTSTKIGRLPSKDGKIAEPVISFNATFAAARKQHGPGKTFVYKSKEYSTSYAEELNNDSVNFAEDQKENINADEILAETSGTIGTIVFSHTDKPND